MKKALLIGINYYDLSNITLNGCINDIININNMLIDAYDYKIDNIIMLRDDLSYNQPTKDNILNNLKSLILESNKLDEIWVHYSGHGSRIIGDDRNHEDGYDEVLVPIDYQTKGFIIDNDLLDIIKNTKCRTLLVIDCCHSATMFDLPWSFEYDIKNQTIKKIKNNNEVLNNTEVFMLSGCKDKQTSSDMFNIETEQYAGALTTAFIYCLRKNNHNIKLIDLYKEVYMYLLENGYKQKPIFSSSIENPEEVLLQNFSINNLRKLNFMSKNGNNTRKIITNNMRTILHR